MTAATEKAVNSDRAFKLQIHEGADIEAVGLQRMPRLALRAVRGTITPGIGELFELFVEIHRLLDETLGARQNAPAPEIRPLIARAPAEGNSDGRNYRQSGPSGLSFPDFVFVCRCAPGVFGVPVLELAQRAQ
jgi:hypothetical protein